MEAIWRFLGDKRNRVILSWLGGGAVVVIGGLWAAFIYFAGDKQSPAPSSGAVEQHTNGTNSPAQNGNGNAVIIK
jgi:hypothetical protein